MNATGDTLSVREAARLVGCSEETVRRWVWRGDLRSWRKGRAHLVSKSELEAVAVARGRPAPPSLASWAAEARAALAAGGRRGRASAADLVLEDRA
ncbi:MAG: helix-turn-helix domain-containing protein [Candidatus Dormibacteria bacterium]